MLGTIIAAVLVLWLLGAAVTYTLSGFLLTLLGLALVTIFIKCFRGRRITS